MKWNESGFRPPLCTYGLNWSRRTSWGWWDEWDDTVHQRQDSKFDPWRSEAEHATFRWRKLPTILSFTRRWGRNNFVSFKPLRPGTKLVKGSGANHYPRAPARTLRINEENKIIGTRRNDLRYFNFVIIYLCHFVWWYIYGPFTQRVYRLKEWDSF